MSASPFSPLLPSLPLILTEYLLCAGNVLVIGNKTLSKVHALTELTF